jgi:hypothetical protein
VALPQAWLTATLCSHTASNIQGVLDLLSNGFDVPVPTLKVNRHHGYPRMRSQHFSSGPSAASVFYLVTWCSGSHQ